MYCNRGKESLLTIYRQNRSAGNYQKITGDRSWCGNSGGVYKRMVWQVGI